MSSKRVLGFVAFLSIVGACFTLLPSQEGTAYADELRPGGVGTCSALWPDGDVIAVEAAPSQGRSHNYVACRERLMRRVTPILCSKGEGNRPFLYKIGAGSAYKTTVRCR